MTCGECSGCHRAYRVDAATGKKYAAGWVCELTLERVTRRQRCWGPGLLFRQLPFEDESGDSVSGSAERICVGEAVSQGQSAAPERGS